MRTLFVILSRRQRGILHLADSVFSALEMFACPRYLCTVHIETIGKISFKFGQCASQRGMRAMTANHASQDGESTCESHSY